MKAGWQKKSLDEVLKKTNKINSLQFSETVRPELVEGQKLTPEFIEGQEPSIHPSTSSGRTDGERSL
jgi:hypothetical protein